MTVKHLRIRLRRFMGLTDRARRDRELVRELECHVQLHTADNLRAGMTPIAARRDALIRLGGFQQTLEQCRDIGSTR